MRLDAHRNLYLMCSVPSLADASDVSADTGATIAKLPARESSVPYIAAALALLCGRFRTANGAPKYKDAYSAVVDLDVDAEPTSIHSQSIKAWMVKLLALEAQLSGGSVEEVPTHASS